LLKFQREHFQSGIIYNNLYIGFILMYIGTHQTFSQYLISFIITVFAKDIFHVINTKMGFKARKIVKMYIKWNSWKFAHMWPICSKPVASRIFDFFSTMHHFKEEDTLFIMTQKLSFYLNPNWNYQQKTTRMCGTNLWQKCIKTMIHGFITCLKYS